MGRLRHQLTGTAVVRAVLAALAVYAIVLIACLLPGRPLDPNDQETALYAVTVLASLLASAAGAAAGAWQGRALAGAVAVVLCGLALTAANGGTSGLGDALIYLAHPVGAAAGALACLRHRRPAGR